MMNTEESDRLEQQIEGHELLRKAKSQHYCSRPDLMYWTAAEISRTKLDDSVKKSILRHMESDDSVVRILIYFTSDVTPEPLSGRGDIYSFMFHPDRDELIQTDVGTWKS
jgi:hypothetical protein